MATFKKFTEILAWQKARELTKEIYKTSLQKDFNKDLGLRDQIRRSCVSVMANIAEGSGKGTDKDFKRFLEISHGSLRETQSHLYVCLDVNYINESDFKKLDDQAEEVAKLLNSLIKYLRA